MSGIKDYSTTPADNNASPPNGFPEGMAPASVNDSMRQVMADIRSWYIDPVWIDFGDTATYSSGTAFLIAGDVTARYVVGTRIRATGTTPFTIYGVIATSSYSAPNTTVTVTWDSGSMDATLSGVALNQFSKAGVFNSAALGTLAFQSANLSIAINGFKGADIASAGTTNIATATGNYVDITGTTTITALGTAQAGTERVLQFDGVLTLTHNGTSLILPTGANITTAAGDVARFVSEGSGNWRCVAYTRANGKALARASDLVLHIQDQKTANTAGGTFTSGAWQTRTLNTEVTDTIGSTLSSNQFTLPAGTYDIDAIAPAFTVGLHKAKLYNVTDAADTLQGTSASAQASSSVFSYSVVRGRFTIAGTKTFEIRHQCQTTRATDGFGIQSNFGVIEVYTDVKITKIDL